MRLAQPSIITTPVLVVTPNSSGKTGFILAYIFVALVIWKEPELCPLKELRPRPGRESSAVIISRRRHCYSK